MPTIDDLDDKHPADWSGATLPNASNWRFVIDDLGCPVWKTQSPPSVLDDNVEKALVRIDDSHSLRGERHDDQEPNEYTLYLIGYGRPVESDIDLDKETLSQDDVNKILNEMGQGNNPLRNDGVEYEIPIETRSDPTQLLPIAERVFNGEFLITENTETKKIYNEGKWGLHTL